MNGTQSIKEISIALLKAQKEIGAAKKGSVNPFFHSKYADLGSVMEACKEALNTNGITVLQPVGHDEHGDYVETVLLHDSGEYISSQMRLVATTDVQKQGSTVTYARRYSLQSMLFIPSEDDDGNRASEPTGKVIGTTYSGTGIKTTYTDESIGVEEAIVWKCPTCKATKTPSGKVFHSPTCTNKEGRV